MAESTSSRSTASPRVTTASATSNQLGRSKTVCQLCRQRKVGCDRQLPSCGFCLRNRAECKYIAATKRPGLRAGYVSQLELRLVDLEKRVRDLESKEAPQDRQDPHAPSKHLQIQTDQSTDVPEPTDTPMFGGDIEAEPFDQQEQNETPSAASAAPEPVSSALDPLSPLIVNELCGVWFDTYHPWFPILHQPSLLETLQTAEDLEATSHWLVVKAIVAVTIIHSESFSSSYLERQQWSETLRDRVVMEAMAQSHKLQSIQALLILSNLDYGYGQSHKFWNLIALCKRMCLHLGMRDLVINQGDNFNKLSTVPPRMLPLPNTIIDREERVRAYWMTEVLDNISTLGAGWNISISPPEVTAILPCSDSIWAFPEHIINIWSIGEFHFSSAFSLCIILAASELWHIHRFLQKSFDLRLHEQRMQCQAESQQIDERFTTWRGEFVAAVYRLINAEHAQEERAEMDPNIVLTNCILDCAVIVLFQRLGPSPPGIENSGDAWPYATNRCIYACDDLAAKVRLVHDSELAVSNPHLIFTVFVAARFYLLYARAVDCEIPRNLYVLSRALVLAGKRWPLARRYHAVIQTATAEHRIPVLMSSLPLQFFDPRYSTLDIDEAVRIAAETLMSGVDLENADMELPMSGGTVTAHTYPEGPPTFGSAGSGGNAGYESGGNAPSTYSSIGATA